MVPIEEILVSSWQEVELLLRDIEVVSISHCSTSLECQNG